MLFPYNLHWYDLDPARHPFDSDRAQAIVDSLAPDPGFPSQRDWAWLPWMSAEWVLSRWPERMTVALTQHYGAWACGWRWIRSIEEGWESGPVSAWTEKEPVANAEEALDRAIEALLEWRSFLEDLAGRCARFPMSVVPEERERTCERAAVDVVTHVVDWAGGSENWHHSCARVLRWYLTHHGVTAEESGVLIDRAIGGRFTSWVTPDPDVVGEVAGRLATGIVDRDVTARGDD